MNVFLVDSVEEGYKKIEEYENETVSKFSVQTVRSKDFGVAELYSKKGNSKILWFDTLPYIFVNQRIFDCKYGPDRHISFKLERKKEENNRSDHAQGTKTKRLVQFSRKLGCPAKVSFKEVFTFPEFTIPTNNKYSRVEASKKLRASLQKKEIGAVKKFILTFPADESDHAMHPVGEGAEIHQFIDKRLKMKIKDLVADSVTDTMEIKRYLYQYVTKQLFPETPGFPPKSNRRYFPFSIDIRNIVNRTLRKLFCSTNDQEKIQHMVDDHLVKCPDYIFEISDNVGQEETMPTEGSTTENETSSNEVIYEEPVQQASSLAIKGTKVREMLAEIQTLSHEINDPAVMECLSDLLEPVLKYVSTKTVKEKGLSLSQKWEVEPTNKCKRSKKDDKNTETLKYSQIKKKRLCQKCY